MVGVVRVVGRFMPHGFHHLNEAYLINIAQSSLIVTSPA
jgi:hypothetical protein